MASTAATPAAIARCWPLVCRSQLPPPAAPGAACGPGLAFLRAVAPGGGPGRPGRARSSPGARGPHGSACPGYARFGEPGQVGGCGLAQDSGRDRLAQGGARVSEGSGIRLARALPQLKIRAGQSVTGPAGQVEDARRGQAEQRRRLGRGGQLDVGMPQRRPPPLGQRQERLQDRRAVWPGRRRAAQQLAGVGKLLIVHRNRRAASGGPPDGRQQVRAERVGRSAAAPDRVQYPAEGQLDGAIGRGGRAEQLRGQVPRRRGVPGPEQVKWRGITGPDGVEQFRVAAGHARAGCLTHDSTPAAPRAPR